MTGHLTQVACHFTVRRQHPLLLAPFATLIVGSNGLQHTNVEVTLHGQTATSGMHRYAQTGEDTVMRQGPSIATASAFGHIDAAGEVVSHSSPDGELPLTHAVFNTARLGLCTTATGGYTRSYFREGMTSSDECKAACRKDCPAVTWYFKDHTCHVHTTAVVAPGGWTMSSKAASGDASQARLDR